jgi:hypothetical protein
MEEWFDHHDIDHFITHYGRKGQLTWNSVAFLYGRYILTVQVKVEVDYKNCEILKVIGDPKIFLHEVDRLRIEGGQVIGSTMKFDGLPQEYEPEKWNELELNNGDLNIFSIPDKHIRKNDPIKRFQEYRRMSGKDIVQIIR